MDELLGTLVFAVLVIGVVAWVVRSYASTAPDDAARHLDAGEHAAQKWIGEIDDASARAVTVLFTSKGRLVIVCDCDDGVGRFAFASPDDVVVRHLGAGPRRIRGGESVCFEFAGRDGAPLRVLLHESSLPHLAEWESAAARVA